MLQDAKKILPVCFELLLLMARASAKVKADFKMAVRSFFAAFILLPFSLWTLQVHPLLYAEGDQPSIEMIAVASFNGHVISTVVMFALIYLFLHMFQKKENFLSFVTQINWLAFVFSLWTLVIHAIEAAGWIDFQFAEDIFVVTQIYAVIVLAVCFYGTFKMDWVWGAFFACLSIIVGDAFQDLFYYMIDLELVDYAEYFTAETPKK